MTLPPEKRANLLAVTVENSRVAAQPARGGLRRLCLHAQLAQQRPTEAAAAQRQQSSQARLDTDIAQRDDERGHSGCRML